MKKKVLCGVVMGLSLVGLFACDDNLPATSNSNPTSSVTTNGGSTTSSNNKKNMLSEALKKDYSNMCVSITLQYYDGFSGSNLTEEYAEYYYNDYTVVAYKMGEETSYSYYHEYEGDSYLWFDKDDEEEKSKAGWINKGWRDSDLSLGYTYFDFNDVLEYLSPSDVAYIGGEYFIRGTDACAEVGSLFLGYWNFASLYQIEYMGFEIDENGYLSRIYALEDEDNEETNYLDIQMYNFGSTQFNGVLPVAPNEDNVIEYWEYRGWDGPWVDIFVNEITLAIDGTVVTEEGFDAVLELDEELSLKATYGPENYNYTPTITWVSEDETVASVSSGKVVAKNGGTTNVYARYEDPNGNVVTSNKIKIKVKGIPEQNKADAIYDFSFASLSTEGVVSAANKVDNVKPFEITTTNPPAGKVMMGEGKNSAGCWKNGEKAIVLQSGGSSTTYALDSFVQFYFSEQQVSSISMYYGMFYEAGFEGLPFLSKIAIETSNDGITWESIDIKDEVKENVSANHKKLMEKEFAPASYVRIATHSSMVGKNLSLAFGDIAFMANEKCNNYIAPGDKIPVQNIDISSDKNEVYVGNELSFNSLITPSNSTEKTLTWLSSNPEVATISEGKLNALKAGTTKITASCDGVTSNEVEITVKALPALENALLANFKGDYDGTVVSLSFEDNNLTAKVNDSEYTLTYSNYLDSASATGRYYVYQDNDGNELCVRYSSYSGSAYFHGKLGDLEFKNEETIEKYVPATSITLTASNNKTEFIKGVDYSFVVTPSYSAGATGLGVKDLTWLVTGNVGVVTTEEANNGSLIATITGTGTVTFKATNAEGIEGSLTVTVREKVNVEGISLDTNEVSLEVGSTHQIVTTFTNQADKQELEYGLSSDSSKDVVKVSSKGVVTALKEGTAKVVVTATNGTTTKEDDKTATLNVTVTASTAALNPKYIGSFEGVDEMMSSTTTVTINADGTATLENDYGDYYEFSFVSEDDSYAYFEDESGNTLKITHNGSGIFVWVNDGDWTDNYCVYGGTGLFEPAN